MMPEIIIKEVPSSSEILQLDEALWFPQHSIPAHPVQSLAHFRVLNCRGTRVCKILEGNWCTRSTTEPHQEQGYEQSQLCLHAQPFEAVSLPEPGRHPAASSLSQKRRVLHLYYVLSNSLQS